MLNLAVLEEAVHTSRERVLAIQKPASQGAALDRLRDAQEALTQACAACQRSICARHERMSLLTEIAYFDYQACHWMPRIDWRHR